MLGRQIGDVVERAGIAEIPGRADLGGGFYLLPVAERKLLTLFENDRQAGRRVGSQLQRKLAAIRRENRRVRDAPGEEHRFRVFCIEARRASLAVDHLGRDPCQSQNRTDDGKPHPPGALKCESKEQNRKAE